MVGYRNAVYNYKTETVELYTWSEDGGRIVTSLRCHPYFYYEDNNGHETSIFNTKLKIKEFKNHFDKYKFIKERGLTRIFDNHSPVQQVLIDTYWNHNDTEDFVKFPLKIYFVDIEAVGSNGFSSPHDPQEEICVITLYDSLRKKYIVWGLQQYSTNDPDVNYKFCTSEQELLLSFIDYFQLDPPDILSGWNSDRYDIPYIINRIVKVLGEEDADRLSPHQRRYTKMFAGKFGKKEIVHRVDGISCVDYLDIYKKFCPSNRESYKLDYIAQVELDETKVDYGNQSLYEFMINDWQTFVDYNIQDVKILVKLEEGLKYIELLRMLSYVGCTTIESGLGTVSVVTGAAAIEARKRKQRLLTTVVNEDELKDFEGGHVSVPLVGHHTSIVSFDANSLYPNTMITLNTSPETKVGRIEEIDKNRVSIRNVDGIVVDMTTKEFHNFLIKEKISVSRSKVLFSQKKKGILPELMDSFYKKRVKIRKELKKLKADENNSEDKKIKNKIDQLDTKQQAIKIFLNSTYGATANKFCPIGDMDIAESITLTGQAVAKEAREIFKRFVTQEIGITDPVELNKGLIAGDTDSVVFDTIVDTNIGKIKIGELYEKYNNIQKLNSKFGHEIIDVTEENLYSSTFCSKTDKIIYGKIKNLIRHKVTKKKYLIEVGGKSVIMTEDHGCMVMRDGKLIRVSPKEIKETDKMIIKNS